MPELECQSVPDESEGLVVTLADYITIRPNIVKQLTITGHYTAKHSTQAGILHQQLNLAFSLELSSQLF